METCSAAVLCRAGCVLRTAVDLDMSPTGGSVPVASSALRSNRYFRLREKGLVGEKWLQCQLV